MTIDELSEKKIETGFSDANYVVRVSEERNDPVWDAFVEKTPGGHHVQTSLWSQVKASLKWKPVRIIATENGTIVGGAQLLLRSITPLVTAGYLTKGPLCHEGHLDVVELILQQVLYVAQEKHLQMLAIQPANNGAEIARILPGLGFEPSALELAPTASIVLDLTPPLDRIQSGMKRQTRQNIHRGEHAGLLVREGKEADLEAFYKLHVATSIRQKFPPYAFEYYQLMWRVFEPLGSIGLIMAEFDGEPISALLVVSFGDTVVAKILGWSGEQANLRPNDAVFWNAIAWSKIRGFRYFDFEGIDLHGARALLQGEPLPEKLQHSPDFFKLGYGGQVVLYPQAYECVNSRPLNWLYKKLAPTVGGHTTASRILDRLRKS